MLSVTRNRNKTMKTLETKLYSYSELSPIAKARVIKDKQDAMQYQDLSEWTLQECMDSLKAIALALGLRLTNWNIGPHNRNNFCRVNSDESGNKAIAQFVRVLLSKGYARKKTFRAMLEKGTGSFIGICGFTGVCFDEDICEAILEALLDGQTMSKAFDAAADRIMRICEDEIEYQLTESAILESLAKSDEIYTEDGQEF